MEPTAILEIKNLARDVPTKNGPKTIVNDISYNFEKGRIYNIMGPSGAGKSTLVDRLTAQLRKQGKSVGIVAVDPTSPYSGGAILGDRIRMQQYAGDGQDYLRNRPLGQSGQEIDQFGYV